MAKKIELPKAYPVPDNWVWIELGKVVKMKTGYPFQSSKFSKEKDGYKPLIRIRDIVKGYTETYTDEKCPEEYIVHNGDILIGMDGDFNIAKWNNGDALLNQRVCTIQSDETILLNDFMFYFLPDTLKKINDATPSVTVKHLSTKTLEKTLIPIPPMAEQQRIVGQIESLFGKLDEVTEKVNDCLEFSIKRKASIMNKAFNGELTAEWRKKKGLDFEEWKTLRLDQLCKKITDGTHHSPPNTDRGEYMYVTAKNIKVTGVDLTNITYVSKAVHDEIYSRCDVRLNDVLYIKDGATTGVATINTIEKPFSLLSSVAVLRVNKELLVPEYLCFLLNSEKVKGMMISNMSGNAITRLTLTKIKQTELPICSLSEQNEIVKILKNISKKEEELELVCKYLTAKVNMMKKSILARAFRGKLGTNNPDEESAVELLKSILVSE